ncbi:hypothetical protein [Lentzea albidocapillata]|uniref:Uncharacterized protein n=1 Tax=Lentzea albidocapillata TaxID=40571 RepID=A0A1W2CKD8_9PSEU|nr:hypothetical protein [Lentzea albidocapillata]SMC85651.1 hypothetical protein SAMN05660733_02141 [Lentzea albidocapillata]
MSTTATVVRPHRRPSEAELGELGVVEYVIKGVPNRKIVAAIRRAAEENADR